MSCKIWSTSSSILGALLFILYINDLPLSISNCNTDMYADDSTIHISGENISVIQTKIQEDLNRIELWCKDKNMFINCSKTKCMTVGTKQKLAFQNEELSLTINFEQLQHSACEKLLDIKIDSNLHWKNQIDQICSKISSTIYLLSKIKNNLNLESRHLFYLGYILPLIDYCCVVWGNCSNEGLNRILKLQKRTAGLILDQDPIAPSEPLFKQLGWMTIEQRIKYHKHLLVSKCLKNEAPVYLKNKIQYLSDRNPYSLRNVVSEKLQIPKAKLNFLRKPLHTLDQNYGMNFRFRYGKLLLIMHLKQKFKVSF
jgi:hypothetical protein